ncbi:MAG: NAD-dependent epimerase/dehydratase family protein [Bacteroides sp.]|nr:NAD-dependent epimerase/dehydratase family protein [Bacteroides sp.]
MNILITGIHGFIGSHLLTALRKDHHLYGLDIVYPEKEGLQCTYGWDICSCSRTDNDLPEFDAIIHLAGKAHDTRNLSSAASYFDINTGLTREIFDFFLRSTAKKFIFFSSVKAAADSVPGEILTEDIIPCPKGPYGESKIKTEEYIQQSARQCTFCSSGEKQIYILRPSMIHGPGNKGNLNLLYQIVKKGVPWPLGAFQNRRSFTSIDNVTWIIKELLEKEIASGIYHLADDEPLSTNELIETMCEGMGKRSLIWKLPRPLMKGAATAGSLLHLPLNRERLTKLTENYVVSNEKIKKALGAGRLPVNSREGILKAIQSFEQKRS